MIIPLTLIIYRYVYITKVIIVLNNYARDANMRLRNFSAEELANRIKSMVDGASKVIQNESTQLIA